MVWTIGPFVVFIVYHVPPLRTFLGLDNPIKQPWDSASRNEWDPRILTANSQKDWLPSKDPTPDILVHESRLTFVLIVAIPSRVASFNSFNTFNIA